MITSKEAVDAYVGAIPPMQETLRNCYAALNEGNLPAAARHAAGDPALLYYLRQLTTKPLYGFASEIKDPGQIFGILGLGGSRSVVESFLFSRLLPDSFEVFAITPAQFMAVQDEFLIRWLKVLKHLKADETRYAALVPLLMGAIIVADAIFGKERDTVLALKQTQGIGYDTLLKRSCGLSLLGVVAQIGRKWELSAPAVALLERLSERGEGGDALEAKLAKWLHLLFFYMLSQPVMVEAGLNDFMEFDPEYVKTVMDDFLSVVDAANH